MGKTTDESLCVAVASGKGGTGKTTVAVSLALTLCSQEPVQLVDCDVEEPNAHLFIDLELSVREPVQLLIPHVDDSRCTRCGACSEACRFGALAVLARGVLVHPELCHGCGLCALTCPEGAIHETARSIGWVERGTMNALTFLRGILNVGEPMAAPIIDKLKAGRRTDCTTILDAPPGTGCPVIAALKGSDFALLVTEPTPFGLHDLSAAVEVCRALGLPAGVVVNRHGIGDENVARYCEDERIPVLMRIPMDRKIAASNARGVPLVKAFPEWRASFLELYNAIKHLTMVPR